jgi:DNA-directed RNA polymerase subunit beta
LRYELGKPRYTASECRQLRLTYGRPLRIWLRLNREQPVEEEVYLGDLPIMMGGGEFIINGAERVVVSNCTVPGVDFVFEQEGTSDRKLPLPRHSRAWQLDRNQRHEERFVDGQDRPERQVQRDDAAAGDGPEASERFRFVGAFYEMKRSRSPARSRPRSLEGKIAIDDVVYPSGAIELARF